MIKIITCLTLIVTAGLYTYSSADAAREPDPALVTGTDNTHNSYNTTTKGLAPARAHTTDQNASDC